METKGTPTPDTALFDAAARVGWTDLSYGSWDGGASVPAGRDPADGAFKPLPALADLLGLAGNPSPYYAGQAFPLPQIAAAPEIAGAAWVVADGFGPRLTQAPQAYAEAVARHVFGLGWQGARLARSATYGLLCRFECRGLALEVALVPAERGEPVGRSAPDYAAWLAAGLAGRRPLTESERWAGEVGALGSDPHPYRCGTI